MDKAERSPPEQELWRFSLEFYAQPGVAPALISLQDRDGLDVNLMLFAIWLGISGRGRLGNDLLTAAEQVASPIRTRVVVPLRALRRRLRHDPDADVQKLRDGVKALELAGEQLVQARLALLAGPSGVEGSRNERIAASVINLEVYLGWEKSQNAEAAAIRQALDGSCFAWL